MNIKIAYIQEENNNMTYHYRAYDFDDEKLCYAVF